MDHRLLGPRKMRRRRFRRVVRIEKFRACEAVIRGAQCNGRFVFKRRDPLGKLRQVCEPCAYADELCFPIIPEFRSAVVLEPARVLRPLVAPSKPQLWARRGLALV